MHRATLASTETGCATEQLGHHPVHVGALGDDMAVPAVRGGQIVLGGEGQADTRGNRLLAE
jgi:hypothetical protein